MMRVLSDVFPPEIKPVRDGWYLTAPMNQGTVSEIWSLRYWDGRDWTSSRGEPYERQDWWSWRGLAFDPAGAVHDEIPLYSDEGLFARYQRGVFVPWATCDDWN